jgi:ubiquitin-activating enzyme E1
MFDNELYDRQIRTFGQTATIRINSSSVCIIGLKKGLATEIAKNLVLCGIKTLYLYDNDTITSDDLLTGYYYNNNDIGLLRNEVLSKKIQELNQNCTIIPINNLDNLEDNDVLICINLYNDDYEYYNEYTRKNNQKFICLNSSNNQGFLFVDAGENHIITNISGENYEPVQVLNIDYNGLVTTNGHDYQSGDIIYFSNLQGSDLEEFNNKFKITVKSKYQFSINIENFKNVNFNFINGTCNYVDIPIIINHECFYKEIINPTMHPMSDSNIVKNYIHSDIEIISVNSVFGSIAASEAIKLITNKYEPITQWFTWQDQYLDINNVKNKLENSEFFIVGSGAIGCELLKNLAFLNVKKIILTDPDTIEKSNLSRQFLFRPSDIGKLKSEVASKAIQNMKNDIIIEYYDQKVQDENIDFTNKILSNNNLTGVFNALDNLESRKFMDYQCFNFNKPLFESGTMGIKGNTQPVIPFLTEIYSNSNDPIVEKSFAVCTIKNFPNEIHHTIHWALDQFEFFNRAPNNLNKWLKDPNGNYNENDKKDIWLFTTKYNLKNYNDCIFWAFDMFYDNYRNQILQLLENFPRDALNSEGKLFWSNGKKCPEPISLDINNDLHREYIITTSTILCKCINIEKVITKNDIIFCIPNYKVNKFIPNKSLVIASSDKELDKENTEKFEYIISNQTNITEGISQNFDKDVEVYIRWIHSASNLRALNYSIVPVDLMTTKGIAGKIIPAIATTTALVAGLITNEMIKYLSDGPIDNFKSTFVNLATNLFVSAEPLQAKTLEIAGQKFNQWHKFIETEDITLKEFIKKYNELFKITINMVSLGGSLLYADFLHDENLDKKISELLEDSNENKLSILCEDETLELPDIIFYIK